VLDVGRVWFALNWAERSSQAARARRA
jgi:hypothetical protein